MLDVRVKERLTGAIILVALLVLLVPELLTGPSRSATSTATQAPPPNLDGAQMRSYTINLSDDPNAQHAGAPPVTETPTDSAPAPDSQTAAPASAAGSSSVEAPLSSASETATAGDSPRRAAADAPRGGAAEESRAAAGEIPAPTGGKTASRTGGTAEAGVTADVSRATEGRKSASRADAGSKAGGSTNAPAAANVPPPSRTVRAEPMPRVDATPAPSGKGWAVQVGSFASRENAEKLTRQLKGKGFAASVSESSGKGGKRLWRVRVGPEADRAAAVALVTRLRSAGLSGGAVVPYP